MAVPGHGLQDPCALNNGDCLCQLPPKFLHYGCGICGGIERTPLVWFRMLRAVGLATYGGAPATGGTMCVGRILLTKAWGVLQFINDPHLQSLECAEVPCDNYHLSSAP